jgi:hypothetical protein
MHRECPGCGKPLSPAIANLPYGYCHTEGCAHLGVGVCPCPGFRPSEGSRETCKDCGHGRGGHADAFEGKCHRTL